MVERKIQNGGGIMPNNKSILMLVVVWVIMTIGIGGCGMGTKESVVSEKYPVKPVTIIVPFAAGGSGDLLARALEKTSQKYLGQPLVVVNMPGGAATIGMNELAGAKPDGYTIGIAGVGAMLQPLYGQTRYHYPTALEPLVNVVSSPTVVACLTEKPWNTVHELVDYAKQHPGEIKFGHSGLGGGVHIVGEMFAKEAGIKLVQVPFKGDSESLAALLGGHIQLIFTFNSPSLMEQVKAGKIKILGVAEEKRLAIPGLENVPTFKEEGVNVVCSFWTGIAAPKGMPAPEKAKLSAGLKGMVNDPGFKKSMEEMGLLVEYLGPDEFSTRWLEDNSKVTKMVKDTGIVELIASQKK
jgi:tripartite-type tricarboxylate transporter receptor subunit TctC